MEFQAFSIRQLTDDVLKGAVRIPSFQRDFVWDFDHVAYLMDSIYKQYPFGSLLFWRTKNRLTSDKRLGSFKLPEAPDEYPVYYVLDGQQRITSIFSVFQTELEPIGERWPEIYFNIVSDNDYQESLFSPQENPDLDKHFPLSCLFDPVKYRQATDRFAQSPKILRAIDDLQARFKEVTIPVQILTTEERSSVAIVFERINRLGMELDTLQLLSAWTWNEDFDLIDAFRELKDELEDFGFAEVGDNTSLILRCASAILTGDSSPDRLIDLNGTRVRESFPIVRNGILGAIDFFRKQLRVAGLKCLPYSALLTPLAVFFAEPDGKDVTYSAETYRIIRRWFWRSCFSRRYTSQPKKTAQRDIEAFTKLKDGRKSNLDDIQTDLGDDYFSRNVFKLSSAITKSFILMLINEGPRSLLSGAEVDVDRVLQKYNRGEFHHLFPKAFLRENAVEDDQINCLANFAVISGADNRKISRKRPSEYRRLCVGGPEDFDAILKSALCPASLFDDNYDKFLADRDKILLECAQSHLENG
ncbi:DUF262 domain-containing protein [Thiobaca trueperi]|uniref:GmrSD restriction endonucleases N-terminal domain-containing protein n=1 Tax=Thiobaca trueperi TaxID=127458 RepID=A0A4R3MW68_9GAMM|nr:DUF262 domain-containing protein [Thiobaca trueperi]TCT18983.1 hypothetical protein EDC35_11030 [Thiobaca trueperi]